MRLIFILLLLKTLENLYLFLCLAYASIDDVIQAVKSKEVDGMLLDRFAASYYQSRGKLKSLLTVKKLELQRDAGVLFSQDRWFLAQCLKDYHQANVLKAVQTFTNSYKVTSILYNREFVSELLSVTVSWYTRFHGILGSFSKPRRRRRREPRQPKAEQWMCTCVLNLGTFLCRPLQNNNEK